MSAADDAADELILWLRTLSPSQAAGHIDHLRDVYCSMTEDLRVQVAPYMLPVVFGLADYVVMVVPTDVEHGDCACRRMTKIVDAVMGE